MARTRRNMKCGVLILLGIFSLVSFAAPLKSIIGARSGMGTCEGKTLPYDAEVEYLESTAAQFISTDFVCDKTIEEIDFTFSVVANVPSAFFLGNGWDKNYLCIGCGGGTRLAISVFCGKYLSPMYQVEYGHPVNIYWSSSNQILEVTDIESGESTTYTQVVPSTDILSTLIFFGSDATHYRGRMRLYSAFVQMPDAVMDLIPVRIGSIGCLYNRANPQSGPLGNGIYPNMGNRDFVLGPDM